MILADSAFTFHELMQMFIHWDERSRSMFTDCEYQNFLDALNDLAAEFGRSWVERLAGVRKTSDSSLIKLMGNDNMGDGGMGILRAIQFQDDWSAVKHCKNADKLRAKLSKSYDNHHVDLEIHVAAAFARCGATVELEPELSSGKVSDFRVQGDDGGWLYVEVSKRIFEIPKLEQDIQTLLELCLRVAPGRACSLHILGNFVEKKFSRIEKWLFGLQGSHAELATIDGLAEFRSFQHGADMATQVLLSREGPLQVKSMGDPRTSSFATSYYFVPDFGFAAKFAEEREQLPSDGNGLIVIDVTGIAGSLAEWRTKASAELDSAENAHILGVALLAKCVDSESFPRWRFDVSLAFNSGLGSSSAATIAMIGRALPSKSISSPTLV
jgi:hypothetical protein